MVEILSQIWQRVLQRPSIGVDDNFFSAGGSFQSADMLFAGIAKEFGRELPSATIYHAQTVAALASLLEQPTLPRFSPFVQVKAGRKQPPILLVHGMAGTVPFFELAQHVQTEHPIYGIQAKGLDGMESPLDRVEDMASFYLDSIRDVQPHGPYILIGYSFGGLVALEMAQCLTRSGEEVALLVLVDAYPHLRFLSPPQRLKLIAQRAMRVLFQIDKRLIRKARRLAGRLRILAGTHDAGIRAEASCWSFEQTIQRVRESAYLALGRYHPRFYQGKIKFVKSGSDSYYPSDPVTVWANLAERFEIEFVPGGHLDMITTDFQSLAAVITRYANQLPGREFELAGQVPSARSLDSAV